MEVNISSYKKTLNVAMMVFAEDPRARFVGYGLLNQKGGNGTFKTIPNEKICETTVAEELMVGMATGMSLAGLLPMVIIERFDFIWRAADPLINYLDKAREISRGEFNPCVILRVIVGNSRKPLFTGPTHTQNYTEAFRHILRMPVYEVKTAEEVQAAYERAIREQREGIGSSFIVEHKELL